MCTEIIFGLVAFLFSLAEEGGLAPRVEINPVFLEGDGLITG